MHSTPTQPELAAFQAKADLSVNLLRNMMGKMVKGWVAPTPQELNHSLPDKKPNATRQLINKLVPCSSSSSSFSSSAPTGTLPEPTLKRSRSSAVSNLINQRSNPPPEGTGFKEESSDSDEGESRSRAVGKKAKVLGGDQFGGKKKKKAKSSSSAVPPTLPGPPKKEEEEEGEGTVNPFRLLASRKPIPPVSSTPKPPLPTTSTPAPPAAPPSKPLVSKPEVAPKLAPLLNLGPPTESVAEQETDELRPKEETKKKRKRKNKNKHKNRNKVVQDGERSGESAGEEEGETKMLFD